MICGIHYFSTELKKKIDVIPRSCFKLKKTSYYTLLNNVAHNIVLKSKQYKQTMLDVK